MIKKIILRVVEIDLINRQKCILLLEITPL